MPAERYFSDEKLVEGALVSLEEGEFHHLIHVMRGEMNDTVELVNGQGQYAVATLEDIKKKQAASLRIQTVHTEERPSETLILAQAFPRSNRLDTILEKGTELGMTHLWLFPGQRSERQSMEPKQIERMRSVLIAAMKQCGRLYLPEIVVKPPILQWDACPAPAYFGDVNPEAPWLSTVPLSKNALVVIGPESGFTQQEEEALRRLNIQGVKLHDNILRTDTAAIAALTLLYHLRHRVSS